MKNMKKFLAIFAILTLIFAFATCSNDDSPGSGDPTDTTGGGGVFTLTNIPAGYNEKYVFLYADYYDEEIGEILGAQSFNATTEIITAVQISNNRAYIPMWSEKNGKIERYSGNHTVEIESVMILNSADFKFPESFSTNPPIVELFYPEVTFSNGSATKSWNDGETY